MIMKLYSALSDKERRQLFHDLVETNLGLIWQCDQEGHYVYLNPAWETVLGYTRDEMLGCQFSEFLPPESRVNEAEKFQRMMREGAITEYQTVLLGKFGDRVQLLVKSKGIFDSDGQCIGARGTALDITERVNNEMSIQQANTFMRSVLNNSRDMIYCLNLQTGRYEYMSPSAELILSYAPDEFMEMEAKTAIRLIHPDDLPRVKATLERLMHSGVEREEYRFQGKDGTYRWLSNSMSLVRDEAGNPLYREGIVRDITSVKETEESLRKSEQRLKYHIENSPLAVIEWDTEFIVTHWSKEAERVFGWNKKEVLGKRLDMLHMVYDADYPIVERTMQRLSGGKERTVVASNRNYTKSGAVIDCVWYNSVLVDEHGKMVSVLSLIEDVTEPRRAHQALVESARLARKEAIIKAELLNEVNHRVKNNLMVILGLLLAETKDAEREVRAFGEKIQRRVTGLLDAHKMLSDSQWQALKCTELAERIGRSVLMSFANGNPGVELCVSHSDVTINSRQAGNLALVFNELITNSMKHAFADCRQPSITIGAQIDGERLRIEFTDNGCGFPESVLNEQKWDVGLRLVQQIVEHTLCGEMRFINRNGAQALIFIEMEKDA